ncbi:MAG: SpoIID/LytB domain-containing protein [Verrucomicrobia bacterium]|nr:SpoIID/LytB domain-containing protein [Verrucomicrobiota bacterium]
MRDDFPCSVRRFVHGFSTRIGLLVVVLGLVTLFGCGCGSGRGTGSGASAPLRGDQIRVALLEGVREVRIGGEKRVTIRTQPNGRTVFSDKPGTRGVVVEHTSNGVTVGGRRYEAERIEARVDGDAGITINGRAYRGRITVLRNRHDLTVVNTLGIEAYTRAVVPAEMLASSGEEALEAQAIVVRSFGAFHVQRNGKQPFDIPAGRIVYKGMDQEDPRTSKAVDATRGVVLTYRGTLMLPYFSSCCGGYTEYAHNVWGGEQLTTRPVQCPYCKGTRHYEWRAEITSSELSRKLKPAGVTNIVALRVKERSTSGRRITKLEVTHVSNDETYKVTVTLNRFRLLVGPERVRSGLCTIRPQNGSFVFEGRGWGHGVGMCQWGAIVMADKGKSYKQILAFYFPHSRLKRMNW